jgi:hypothetical protein
MPDPKKPPEDDAISIDLTPTEPAPRSLDDDEEEATKVLDWDRAMRKSIEEKKPKK